MKNFKSMAPKGEVIILGAGLSGLSTAYHLQAGYSLYEQESEAGGMARSVYKDGYIFDYDGHLLHFKDEGVLSLVKELLNGNLAPHKRSSWIYSNGNYTQYPFQGNLYGLPKDVIKDCLLGIIKSRSNLLSKGNELDGNFEDWIRKTFGTGIAEHFMVPYNKKFWTIEPKELSCEWLDGFVPVPSLEDIVTGAISNNTKLYGYNSRFWYPVKGGISELVKGFLKRINGIYLNKEAVTIDQYKKEVIFNDGTVKKFKNLVNTIPMPELLSILVDIPREIKNSLSLLRWTSIFVVNLGIKKEEAMHRHWVYFPEDSLVFYRIGFPVNFSADVAPSKKTSVYAEISYSDKKDIDKKKVIRDTIEGMKILGIIYSEDEIETCLPIDIKYGYVLYDRNWRIASEAIKDYLKRFNIYSIGRYGSWRYMSMEDVILEGKMMAEELKLLNCQIEKQYEVAEKVYFPRIL